MRHDTCKFCGERVDLNGEGVTYKDGTSAHEDCHDAEEFERENATELREMSHDYVRRLLGVEY